MKLKKFFIIFFIFALSFIACRKTDIKITEPPFRGPSSLTRGDGTNSTNYNLVGNYGGILGIYKEANGDSYLVSLPDVGDIKIKSEQKKAVDEIIDIIGMENIGSILSGVTNSKDGNLDIDKVVGNANISEEQKNKIKDLIDTNFKNENLDYVIYNK